MSYTYTTALGDGVTRSFPFSFAGQDTGYLAVSNISVFVAGVLVSNYQIRPASPNVVEFTAAPQVGAEILIRRIMPKTTPYADFSRGNPFSQDTLNNTNLQMLYLLQEVYDGYLPDGFYFRVDIDMRGQRIKNLGDGIDSGDAINKSQLDVEHNKNTEQDSRLTAIEDAITTPAIVDYVSQVYTATGGETQVNTFNNLYAGAIYINGIYQHKLGGAYTQTGGVVTFAEPLIAGSQVYFILGSKVPVEGLYPTIDSFVQLQDMVSDLNGDVSGLTTSISTINGQVSTINTAISNRAMKGVNSDITALTSLSGGITGVTTGAAAASGIIGQVIESAASGETTLTTAVSANCHQVTLPAGEWVVDGVVRYTNSNSLTARSFGLSTTSATLPTNFYDKYETTTTLAAGLSTIPAPSRVYRFSAPTTIYLVVRATFASGPNTATGYIRARRTR